MAAARVLVIDGNRAAVREQQRAAGGSDTGEGYAQVLGQLAQVSCDIVRPADGEVRFAPGSGLGSYDGVAITGSALNIYDGGAAVERKFIASLGLDPNSIDNGDGSGLTQGDRITPHDLATLLQWETRSSNGHAFISALAVAGVNGTVRHHLLGSDAVGRVRAKDGYIWHVSTFSGYARTKHHGLIVFSVMFNDADGRRKPFLAAEDKIVETIVDWP